MLGFLRSLEWWARQGLNLRPHPCEGLSGVRNGGITSVVGGTDDDSNANEAALADHGLTTGFVYFIRAGRTANLKIGWAADPHRRLDALQTGCPHRLHLVGFIAGGLADEQVWHDRWRHLRVRGEWFALQNDLRDAVNRRLMAADATCYIHIKTDWRAVRKAAAQSVPAPFPQRAAVAMGRG